MISSSVRFRYMYYTDVDWNVHHVGGIVAMAVKYSQKNNSL